jgi:hypothetical protein
MDWFGEEMRFFSMVEERKKAHGQTREGSEVLWFFSRLQSD